MTTETMPAIRETPIETVTPIKPSEAIRLGCLTKPVQSFGETFGRDHVSACAIGAMAVGFGDRYDVPFERLSEMPCPLGCQKADGQSWGDGAGPMAPAHLNDHHGWSRERIADWLEGLGL